MKLPKELSVDASTSIFSNKVDKEKYLTLHVQTFQYVFIFVPTLSW